MRRNPNRAYLNGLELTRHDGIADNSPEARQVAELEIDAMLNELEAIDASLLSGRTEWITHAYLLQRLRSLVAIRICRTELWNVNQMGGWHSEYGQIAQMQPIGTPELRSQSLSRWKKFASYVDQEIENLKTGLVYNQAFDPGLMQYDEHYQNEQAVSPLFKTHLESVAQIISKTIGRSSLVEVGCGKGFFLA